MRSNLSAKEEYFAPAYAAGWEPRALPRIYLVGNNAGGRARRRRFSATRTKNPRLIGLFVPLAQGDRVSRSRLVGLLWDRSAEAQARMSLRQSLSELNSIVNRHVPGLVEIDRDSVRLDVGEMLGRCSRDPRDERSTAPRIPAISSSLIASASSKISTGSPHRSISGSRPSERASRIVCGKFWRRSSTA